MNLLEETRRAIDTSGHTPEQVDWVGSPGWGWFYWEEFERIAATTDYDSGFGGQEVATDLIIHFSDGTYMHREEYDGSEWWEHLKPQSKPTTHRVPDRLAGGMWDTLTALHEEDGFR